MSSTEQLTEAAPEAADGVTVDKTDKAADAAALGAGLDALETQTVERTPLRSILVSKVVPPLIAIALVLLLWQLAYAAHIKRPDLLPSPLDVWNSL